MRLVAAGVYLGPDGCRRGHAARWSARRLSRDRHLCRPERSQPGLQGGILRRPPRGPGSCPFASHLAVLATGVWLAIRYRSGVPAVAGAYLVAGLWPIGACLGLARRSGRCGRASGWRRVIAAVAATVRARPAHHDPAPDRLASLLGLLRPFTDVANYAASARLFEASQSIVRPLIQVFLPIAAGLAAARAYAELRRSLVRLTALALAAGARHGAGGGAAAPTRDPDHLRPGFAPAAEVLRIHFAATPFVFVGAIAMFHLTALASRAHGASMRRRLPSASMWGSTCC